MELRRTYPVPVDDVWAALTVSARTAAWIGTFTGPGPQYEFVLTGEVDAGGEIAPPVTLTVHECVPGSRLVVEIPQGDTAWTMAVDLAPAGSGTDLTLFQAPPPGFDPVDVEAGWAWYLDRLGAVLTGAAMPEWVTPGS